eukprot:NODE_4278_length_1194_cov_75.207283_g3775_i0.p1 GENE.NODE_4278_length_1194_cov_75.207283_g3775_i0~~NODE_4278_length_1194_cov_75.207283_g3775_i0.p1  ORF type:complete len:149 (+),score=29.40 NODE_4278_length_1194_cov_75.207283_g3775_i0:130-576(+)
MSTLSYADRMEKMKHAAHRKVAPRSQMFTSNTAFVKKTQFSSCPVTLQKNTPPTNSNESKPSSINNSNSMSLNNVSNNITNNNNTNTNNQSNQYTSPRIDQKQSNTNSNSFLPPINQSRNTDSKPSPMSLKPSYYEDDIEDAEDIITL